MNTETRAIEVRTTRKARGMTQEDLAAKSGMAVRTIRNIEAGKDVSPATAALVYSALGMPVVAPVWPDDVDAFLQMVGYRLTALDPERRLELINGITRMLIGR